ncbi:unnamed protein product, partial [Tetraodon nigroviridis]
MLSHPSPRSLLLSLLLAACGCNKAACSPGKGSRIWLQPTPDQSFLRDKFPPEFLWASGTSAFQTEGAWNHDGKGPSIWDQFIHSSNANLSGDSADVASDSYARWEEDVEALVYLGVRSYSFSLSWPRLFADGNARGQPNTAAVRHYSQLIDRLLSKKIEPIVTLHHWDLPQVLQKRYGGWKNATLVGLFEEYAAFCFRTFGRRVRYWLTMHNPFLVAVQGYGTGVHAPGEKGGAAASLIVAHNLIQAHAKAWHVYDAHFRAAQKGKVSIVLGSHWVEPQRGQNTAENVQLCQQSMEAVLGWFADPIFGDGDYPASLKRQHGSLMPTFSPEEKLRVKNTADFFTLSFGPNNLRLGQGLDRGQTVTPDLRRVLGWIQHQYGDPSVLVAEGGWFSEASVGLEDTVSIYQMKLFMNQVLQAMKVDGVRVFGYSAWSLVDGFEWTNGFNMRRGLFYVDFNQANRTRSPKTSAQYYRRVVANHGFPDDDDASPEVKGRFPCEFHWGVADSTVQVRFYPFSPQFTDPHLYRWNLTGDGSLRPVPGVKVSTRPPQCTDYLSIHGHLALFASTGASHYRFALNWSLVLPQGDLSQVNNEALRYYRCVLMELKKLNLEAMVILYYPTHRANLGLPGPLHAAGGWLSHRTVEAFQVYAALCYQQLGPWVSYWITINEPNRFVDVFSSNQEIHRAAHHLLLAHAKAWRLYQRQHHAQWGALVSLALHADWAVPANPFLSSHKEAAHRFLLFELGRFLDPLLGTRYDGEKSKGEYPPELRAYMKEMPQLAGLQGSSLPNFTDAEREELADALGFIALNHFTSRLVSPYPTTQANVQQKQPPDHRCLFLLDPTWSLSDMGQALTPWGLRKILNWVSQRYGRTLPIIVTASGIDDRATPKDKLRQDFLKSYLQEALKAHQLDGVNLRGFYFWRLQDRQYGLFTSVQHHSQAKASVGVYRDVIARGGFPADNATGACRPAGLHEPCSVCEWMLQNKALLVFGGCLLVTAIMLAALVIF